MTREDPSCFGFFGGQNHGVCQRCGVAAKCRAVLLTHGFDIVGNAIELMMAELPDAPFADHDRIPRLTDELIHPPAAEQIDPAVNDIQL